MSGRGVLGSCALGGHGLRNFAVLDELVAVVHFLDQGAGARAVNNPRPLGLDAEEAEIGVEIAQRALRGGDDEVRLTGGSRAVKAAGLRVQVLRCGDGAGSALAEYL